MSPLFSPHQTQLISGALKRATTGPSSLVRQASNAFFRRPSPTAVKSDPEPPATGPMVGSPATGTPPTKSDPQPPAQPPTVQSPGGLTPTAPNLTPVLPSQQSAGASVSAAPAAGAASAAPGGASGGAADDYYRLGHGFLEDYDKSQEPFRRGLFRTAGQNLAKFGRIGSGMAADQIGEITRNIEADRLSKAYEYTQGERDFRLQKTALEDALANSAFGRDATRAQYLGGYNPSALMGASDRYGQEAQGAFSSVADLIRQMIAQRQGGATTPASGPPRTPNVIPDIR